MAKQKKVIIYVRGHNQELQEMKCRLYAVDKGYKVLYTTKHLEDVNLCDVLLVVDPSRLSRNSFECCKIVKEFNERGIEVRHIVGKDDEYNSSSDKEVFDKLFDKMFDKVFVKEA